VYLTESTMLILRTNFSHTSKVNHYHNAWTNFLENPNVKFYENLSVSSRPDTGGRLDKTKRLVDFSIKAIQNMSYS